MQTSRLKCKQALVVVLALLTFPISLPYFVIKTLRRKRKKAEARRSIEAMDNATPAARLSNQHEELPLLSVIMPVYNIGNFLEASIISVLNQSYSNLELIIVNDASTDNSLAIARMFEKIDSRVRVIDLPFNTPGGAGVPSNIGVENARGSYVGFVDGDDFLNSFAFERLIKAALEHDCDLAVGYFKTFLNDTMEISEPYDLTSFSQLPSDGPFLVQECPASLQISAVPWRKLYKRAFLEERHVSFPEGDVFFEDNPYHWDAMTAARSVVVVRGTIAFHRMNREGQTNMAAAPKLAAYFAHFASISEKIRKNAADFAWAPFLDFVERTDWIIRRQTDPLLIEQFALRFRQTIDEQIAPYMTPYETRPLERLRARFGSERCSAVLSVLLYHDGEQFSDADLGLSISTVREMRNTGVEIILLHNGPTPKHQRGWGQVICIPVGANKHRAYNQALSLCGGEYLAFLTSGDLINPGSLEDLLAHQTPRPDLVMVDALAAQPKLRVVCRRLVQGNGLFFGASPFGWFSFEQLCRVYARQTKSASADFLSRRLSQEMSEHFPCLETEAFLIARHITRSEMSAEVAGKAVAMVRDAFDALELASSGNDLQQVRRASDLFAAQIEQGTDRCDSLRSGESVF